MALGSSTAENEFRDLENYYLPTDAYYRALNSDARIVVGRKGSLGTVFYLPGPFWPHDTTLWVRDFKGNDPYFCHLLLKSLRLANLDAGSSNPTLNRNHAHLIQVSVPAPEVTIKPSPMS